MTPEAAKLNQLKTLLEECGSVLVAFSGGVDSTLVLRVAVDVLGDKVLAVTGRSPAVPPWELEEAGELAAGMGARHVFLDTDELSSPDYVKNAPDRCYHCKSELFDRLEGMREAEGLAWIVDGTNRDDLGDHRPGMRARAERGIKSPLVLAELGKDEVRSLSREYGLPTADKPAFACLASRFPYGTEVTAEGLARVAAAEDCVRNLGFRQYRVRHHGDLARLELEPGDFARALEVRDALVRGLREAGYLHVALDLAGYRTGSLNEGIVKGIERLSSRKESS